MIKFLWEHASFAAQTQSFLCGKFSIARLEVLPNLRHAGVFEKSRMVKFGIELTRRWAFALQLCKIMGIYKFQLAGKWSESEKISCHAILENPYEPKMDVILTISLKITAKNQDKKTCFASYFADEVYRLSKAYHVCVVVQIWYLVWIFLNQFKFFKLVWIFQTS